MAAKIVGLDIGTTALRAVELSEGKKKRLTVLRFYEIPLPPGAVIKGEISQPEIVGPALKRLWSEGGFKSKNVVLGTGNQRTLVRDLSVPKASLQHIRDSLAFHVQGALQSSIEDSMLDFYPVSETVGEHGPQINGLLVSTEKSAVLANIRNVERAGLTPVDVDLIPFALSRLLIFRPRLVGTTALVEVGAQTTSIVIAIDGVPNFVRIIPTGGDDLTVALKNGLAIEEQKAELLKRTLRIGADMVNRDEAFSTAPECSCAKCLADLDTVDDPRVQEILRAVTAELLGSVRNTISYFNNTRPEEPVAKVLLSGGGTQLSGFAEALTEMVHLPVSGADPFALIAPSRKIKIEKWELHRSGFSVALGLAMRSLAR
jgi:type IV pilus assembly protein PilM